MLRQVTVENGRLEGIPAADPRITAFKGVPFAAPPVGELRWKAPQPASNWDGVYKADAFGPMSMQHVHMSGHVGLYEREWLCEPEAPMSEDCLYLNVWTPAMTGNEKHPVLVWYFGGALQMGAPNEMEFDGERLARRGIIVVTVNYRTNVFGFLCHPELREEAPEAPCNFGNLDQQAATRWVKRNIAAFGGDPDRITIGGQSAGGGSVMTQITSPQNEGLVQGAIIQSGVFTACYNERLRYYPPSQAEEQGVAFFDFLGVSSLKEARALDAVYVRDKMLAFKRYFGTVEDGHFNVGDSMTRFLENKRLQIPILLGLTVDEFIDVPNVESLAAFDQMAKDVFGNQAEAFLALCNREGGNLEEMIERARTSSIAVAIHTMLRRSDELHNKAPMYFYNFAADIPGWDHPGAFHSVDLWFFFETLAKCWRPFVGKHYDLARLMCNYWAEFVKKGDPNGKDADGTEMPEWTPYTIDAPYAMMFQDTAKQALCPPDELTALWMIKKFGQS